MRNSGIKGNNLWVLVSLLGPFSFVGGFLGQKTDKQSLFVNMTGIIIHVTTDVGEREREREKTGIAENHLLHLNRMSIRQWSIHFLEKKSQTFGTFINWLPFNLSTTC